MWPFSFFSSSPVGKIRTFKDPRTDDLSGSVMRHDQVIPWVPLSSSSTLDSCLITNVLAFLTGTAWHIKWHGRRTDSWSIGCVIAPPLRTNYRGMWPLKGINYFSLQVVEHYQFLSVLAAFIYLICIYPLSLCLFGVLFARFTFGFAPPRARFHHFYPVSGLLHRNFSSSICRHFKNAATDSRYNELEYMNRQKYLLLKRSLLKYCNEVFLGSFFQIFSYHQSVFLWPEIDFNFLISSSC